MGLESVTRIRARLQDVVQWTGLLAPRCRRDDWLARLGLVHVQFVFQKRGNRITRTGSSVPTYSQLDVDSRKD